MDEASLRELCAELQIELKEETGRLALIQRITKYLDVEELNVEKLQKLKEAIADKKKPPAKIKSEKETEQKPGFHEASVSTSKGSTTIPSFKKEFKISGQTGDSPQKDRLSFTSLAHRINAGLDRGHQEKEVTKAVIRAINPGLRLRSYLEGKPDLTLATLPKILPSPCPAGQGAAQETQGQSQQCVNCGKWEEWADQYFRCSQCHASHYCSNVCQRMHGGNTKSFAKPLEMWNLDNPGKVATK